jgi:hypothetical protein
MSKSKVLREETEGSARELLRVLDAMTDVVDINLINVFGREGKPLRIRLIEDTLTDGSKTYNINIE